MSLQQRVWATVSGAFLSMNLLIVATPLTVSWPPKPWEIACSLTGVIIVSIISWRAIERGFAPVQKVARQIAETPNLDDAAPIQAVPEMPDLDSIVDAHNNLVERLRSQRRATLTALIEGQELERARLSRELHDQIGQTLTYALLLLQSIQDGADQEQKVAMAQEAVRTSLQEVRGLAADLRPSVLSDLGLVAALTSLATAHAEATGVVVRRDLQPVPDLGWAAELVVYRIAQEALTNSAKHAQASTVTLSLHCDQDTVRLAIADDGRGLQGSTPGTGLASMHDRARSINAQLTITDNPGGGTRVELRIDRGTLPHDSLPED